MSSSYRAFAETRLAVIRLPGLLSESLASVEDILAEIQMLRLHVKENCYLEVAETLCFPR
jgi:hypothetical protein